MQLLTIDNIVRTHIHERGLVFHDYFRLLTLALSAVRDISMDININSNVKVKEVDVDSSGAAYIPKEAIELYKIAIESGDKILRLSEVDSINPLQKFENGYPVKRDNVSYNTYYYDYDYYYNFNEKGEYRGREYGIPTQQKFSYQVFDDRVQFDSRLNLSCVIMIYTTNGINYSDITSVHPYAEEAIKAFMFSRFEGRIDRKGVYQKQQDRNDYWNEKRKLNSRLSGLGYEEYMEIVRSSNVMGIR
jgi:hypothetical protein